MLETLIGAGISAIGSFIGGKQQQDASQDFAREQMDFQERMSSTAHQREVKDLRAAGLNPILSTRLGGASTPTGAMGTAVNYIGEATKQGVATALQYERQAAEINLLEKQAQKTEAETVNEGLRTDILVSDTDPEQIEQRKEKQRGEVSVLRVTAEKGRAEINNLEKLFEKLSHETNSAAAQAAWDAEVLRFARSPEGRWAIKTGLFGKALKDLADSVNSSAGAITKVIPDWLKNGPLPTPRRR